MKATGKRFAKVAMTIRSGMGFNRNYAKISVKIMRGADDMSQIRPVSDLRNNFADISHTVHETREPVILTKNGYGDMVVMSYDEYQKIQYEMGVMRELQAAELEAETTTERYAHEDVMDDLREQIGKVKFRHV